jgi:formamidopyrimidine-DNA glycosylase
MPERAEIAIMAYHLDTFFKNKNCKYVVIMERYKSSYNNGLYSSCHLNYQQGQGFKYIDIDCKLSGVNSRGKKIIFNFFDNPSIQIRFVSSCGMDGRWSLVETEKTCIKIIFEDCTAYYEQIYIGGNFSICCYPSKEYDHIFKDVGPDLMNDETTWPIYYNIMRNPKTLHWLISDYMMEQKFMSGIGNYLRADILYKSCIHPKRTLGSLSDIDLSNLWTNTKNTIFESFNSGGLTIKDYTDPFGNKGIYQKICYGKDFDSFGNIILSNEKDKNNRTIHWCPAVQH